MSTIMLPHDYVNFWLTHERWMEYGDASGTGWLDVRKREWSSAMLAATDPDRDLLACLPQLVPANTRVPIAPAVADELGLSRNVRISAGGRRQHDGGHRHRQRGAGRAQHEPRYFRHAVHLRGSSGGGR